MTLHPLLGSALVAAIVSAGIGAGLHYFAKPGARTTIYASAARMPRAAEKSWDSLEQKDVDAITARLNTIKDKRPVGIICGSAACEDLAGDLENAFESAHWTVQIEKPLIDNTQGISSNSLDLASGLQIATGLKLNPKFIKRDYTVPGPCPAASPTTPCMIQAYLIVLGRKPKG